MAADELLVGSIQKNKREQIRVSLTKYKGYDLFNIRVWFVGEDGSPTPSTQGVALQITQLPELAQLVKEALALAVKHNLLPSEGTGTPATSADAGHILGLLEGR